MNGTYIYYLNSLGLTVNLIGAVLLTIFTSPCIQITETGENLIAWRNDPQLEQRAQNCRMYVRHKRGFKGGAMLLALGYVLQLLAVILGQ